jgi:1,4-alpha-glucan branching enzyme
MQQLVRDLNRFYRATPALFERDFDASGFEWIDHEDAGRSVLSFVRKGADGRSLVLVVSNFTPAVHHGVRLGVPAGGRWRERLNTDSAFYGGSNVGAPFGEVTAEPVASHGRAQSIAVVLPPLATVFFEWTPEWSA